MEDRKIVLVSFGDRCSAVPNKEGFKEHRHDQSSFSVQVKKMPHTEISWRMFLNFYFRKMRN